MKKIVSIVLGALLIFGLLFLLWSWFFSGSSKSSLTGGFFGTASDTAQTVGDTTAGGNYTTTLGQAGTGQNSANGSIPLNGTGGTNGSAAGGTGTNGANGTNGATNGTTGTGAGLQINGGGNLGTGGTNGIGTGGSGSTGTGGTNTVGNGSTGLNGGTNTVGNSTLGGGTSGSISVPGVVWLGSSAGVGTTGRGGTGGTAFTPTEINSLQFGAGGSAPTITSSTGGGSSGTSLIAALAGAGIAGSLTCALQAGVLGISGGGASAAAAANVTTPGILVNGYGALIVADYGVRANQTVQNSRNTSKDSVSFSQCLINVIGKVALQQITISVVNWINSGFNGQPSFVTNYEQFFTNVADLAAGQFIQGSGLAFLCSPFKLQIKVAIAQSYANRGAQSCSLTGIIKNVNNFMNGSFTQGGWQGLLQFTTVPTNNPYGAFAYAQVGLVTAQSNALSSAKSNISPTGFLNLQQVTGCDNPSQNGIGASASIGTNAQAAQAAGKSALGSGCKTKVVTPGGVIADSLGAVNKSGIDQLGIGNSIDQIISALTTQLMTKILQNGLSSLSQGTTQTSADLAAQSAAANLLIDMQSKITIAQQLGTIDQGSIQDIESAQANLSTLADCWNAVAASGKTGADSAVGNAATATSTLHTLDARIEALNNNITQLNTEIAAINEFEAQVSSAASVADVTAANASYSAAIAAGSFAAQADVTTAQQNRITLQSQMGALNVSTAASLKQCQAFGN